MALSDEEKREVCVRAPLGRDLHRPDTAVIERPGWYQVVTPSAPGNLLNEVVLSAVEPAEADGAIDEVTRTYAALGRRTKWCVGPWTRPADFGARLESRGFSHWAVRGMGCSTALECEGAPRVAVEEVDASGLDAYLAAERTGWDLPAEDTAPRRAVYEAALSASPRAVHLFVARLDRAVVGTAGLVLRPGAGYLLGTQVLPHARGLGAYRSLVAARLVFLRARGVEYAVTQAREATSAPMLAHLGFETLFRSACHLSP